MKYISDLHIHSKYSRACSPQLTLENIDKHCQIKGIQIVATGDFTHPAWFSDIKKNLVPAESGLYKFKDSNTETRFLCSTEIACIYSKGGQVRRLHIVIFAPSIEVVQKINTALGKVGKLGSDGRPILGLDAKRLAEIIWEIDASCLIIPAHCWTPWFAVFGSKSGFDSLEECFEEHAKKIYAIETGLSSDPAMNWRLSVLDKITLISNSDAHSLPNLGREANVFEIAPEKLSYAEIRRIIREKDREKFLYTIEFFPEEGMYHFDGHRACAISLKPADTKKQKGICPVCKKSLTIGVLNRVEELADQPEGYRPEGTIPFKSLIELDKIIAEALQVQSRNSKQVQTEYNNLINKVGPELKILLDEPLKNLAPHTTPEIVEGIRRVRAGKLIIKPGFDGQYGEIKIFQPDEISGRQTSLL